MNMTRKPVTSVQTKLIATVFWPTVLTTSSIVSPFFASLTGMSPTVPVIVPLGSPLALSSGLGAAMFLRSASVIGLAAGAGAAAGAAAGCAAGGATAAGGAGA